MWHGCDGALSVCSRGTTGTKFAIGGEAMFGNSGARRSWLPPLLLAAGGALSCSEQKPNGDSPASGTTPHTETRGGAGGAPSDAAEPANFGTDQSAAPARNDALGGSGGDQLLGSGGDEVPNTGGAPAPGTGGDGGAFAVVGGGGVGGGSGGEATDCTSPLAPTSTAPDSLLATGIDTLPGVRTYEPAYALWADGSGKDRHIYLPPCTTIDTSDMDHWQFPIGTRLWKHFDVDGKRIETRFLHRFGPSNDDWLMATYGWDAAQPKSAAAAKLVPHGQPNAQGTLHDIPDPSACPSCHGKLPERVLGFGAIQLSHEGAGLTLSQLNHEGWLSVPAPQNIQVPGTPLEQAALGYLHANCGGCHNQQGQIPRENPMLLRLSVSEHNVSDTNLLRTTVGVATINGYPELHGKPRIDPGSPQTSAIFLRMSDRNKFPMPPLASKFADTEGGVAAVRTWIESLSP